MDIEILKNKIKPELESIFGTTMTSLILNKAKMKVATQTGDSDDIHKCRNFIECLGNDDKLIGMWGSLETKERVSTWMNFIG